MMRKLLPYEHQLIRELKISEQEYLDFLQARFDYSRSADEKLQELRGDPVSIVLTVVGILFQVGAALLAPKPQIPQSSGNRQRREERFAPRFGFNSTQELAKYGDPVNLVYCNTSQNTTGGVRVATSLIWSAVASYGSSQFMQNLLVIGAGRIGGVDFTRMAFGQTPIRQFVTQKAWTYYNANGNVRFSDLQLGDAADPTRTDAGDFAYRTNVAGSWAEGFSQAFSPTTLTRCGVFAPIPLNIQILERKSNGDTVKTPLGITVDDAFVTTYWTGLVRPLVPIGARMTVTFDTTAGIDSKSVVQSAADQRQTLFQSIDAASAYKLGSAKFRLVGPLPSTDLDTVSISVTFECIEAGYCPQEDYITTLFSDNRAEWEIEQNALTARNAQIDALLLNPAPIYLTPDAADATVASDLAAIEATVGQLQDFVEDVRAFRRAYSKNSAPELLVTIEGLAENALVADPIVTDIVTLILSNEDELINNDSLTKAQRRAIKRTIKKLQRELNNAINQYGVAEGFIVSPRTGQTVNGKEEIKIIKRIIAAKGTEAYQRLLNAVGIAGRQRDYAAEAARDAPLRKEKAANLARINALTLLIQDKNAWNDYFNTKCLTKIEEAAYETITNCQVVNFSLKAKVYKRINGRAKKYGDQTVDQYKSADNGLKIRVSMFWLWYKRPPAATFSRVPYVFAIRRGGDNDNFIDLNFIATDSNGGWQFRLEPIADTGAEFREYGTNPSFAYIENGGVRQTITNADGIQVTFTGNIKAAAGNLPPLNNNPWQVDEWGLFSNMSDTQITFSFDNGPEIAISAVTEQRVEALSAYPQLYNGLSLLGFNAYSGQGMQDLRSITAFVTQGKLVRNLNNNGTYSAVPDTASSYAPEIFLDTVIDNVDGIGQFAKVGGIDLVALAKAKRFCQVNGLFFDGVIAQQTPWRQFWAEVAPYSLLELGRIGGKETLVPAVPCDTAGNITRTVPISAMFNAGNILEGSYKEEFIDYGSSVQDLIASVIYRDTEVDGVFPRNRSVEVSLAGVTETTGVRQTFDLSDYVTNKSQAIMFAKLLCNQRRHIRRNIEFRTFPTDSPLSPGAYVYVDMGQQDWQGIYSGQVGSDGSLNMPIAQQVPDGTYNALLYRSGQAVVTTTAVLAANASAQLAAYPGWLFVLGTAVKAKRVFRIVEVLMDEEGEIGVRATEHPCDTNGLSLIADFTDSLFSIR